MRLPERPNALILVFRKWVSHFLVFVELTRNSAMRTFHGLLIFLLLVPVIVSASEVTKEAQILLNQLGYKAGAADGVWGNKTKSAIKKFYLNQGSEFDGVLDQNGMERQ